MSPSCARGSAATAATAALALTAALAAMLAWGCSSPAARRMAHAVRVEEPHAASLPDGSRVRVWGAVSDAGEADIACQVADAAPVIVNPRAGSAVAGRQVGPRVAVTPDGAIVVSWIDRGRDPAGDVLVARSTDRGRTFAPPVRADDDGGAAGQEYQDIAALTDGSIALVWLDERDAPAGEPNRKQVYFALSADGGRRFGPSAPVTSSPGGVCPCCRPALAAGATGALHALYRDRDGDELFLRVATRPAGAAGFLPPVTVSRRGWAYPACPVDGPALLAAPGEVVHAAWMDGSAGPESLWRAVSRDGGLTFEPARALCAPARDPAAAAPATPGPGGDGCCAAAEERQGRPSLAWDMDRGVIAAWEACGVVWVAAIDRPGEPPQRVGEGASPCLAAGGGRLDLFWSQPQAAPVTESGLPALRSRFGRQRIELGVGK